MSSLLGNLITQVATSALTKDAPQQSLNPGGDLGSILGNVLGNTMGTQQNNQFGLDDVLGQVLGAQQVNTNTGGGLGSILDSVLGNKQSSGQGMLLAVLLPMILNWVQSNGGLSGALAKIQGMGMQQQVGSWMSTNQSNSNLSLEQVGQLFGRNEISQVSQQTGANENMVMQGIAELLPEVMNQLTPQGGMQAESQANQEIGDILAQLAGGMMR